MKLERVAEAAARGGGRGGRGGAARGGRRGGGGRAGRAETTLMGRYVGRPVRGRQYTSVVSPDEVWEAEYVDFNVRLKNAQTGEEKWVTTEGDEKVHFGTASWVYGEELGQNKAMWWSPDSKKLLYYKFDDSNVEPFYLVRGWSDVNTDLYPENYPKAGANNPIAELMVYDMATGKSLEVEAGDDPEQYIYNVRTTPDGATVLMNRTNRHQNHLDVLAIDLETGETRVVVTETQETWQSNSPSMRYLDDDATFIWPTERTGYTHYELRHIDGRKIATLTRGEFQTGNIQFVDETGGWLGFTGYSAENPYHLQYHLARMDGTGQRRVTSAPLHHSGFDLSPDRKWLVAQAEDVNTPPSTYLYTAEGKQVFALAESDPAEAADVAETFSFRSIDDNFDVYGILYKPRDFDPNQKYPLIVDVYGGPNSNAISASYVSNPRAENQRGYLIAKVANRGTANRGKAFLGAVYLKLGDVDIQDQADGVRHLMKRPYVDPERTGIVGHSYGGYMAALGVLKHPDAFKVAVNRAGVTDWRNYDTIYTERYMRTPQENAEGYDGGSAMKFVERFTGKMLIMHGMVDDNVHPNNAFQLIEALDAAGKTYESRFWPNGAHGLGRGVNETQWEFFDRHLKPAANGR
jgi:dipeptidyl-peptidase-4